MVKKIKGGVSAPFRVFTNVCRFYCLVICIAGRLILTMAEVDVDVEAFVNVIRLAVVGWINAFSIPLAPPDLRTPLKSTLPVQNTMLPVVPLIPLTLLNAGLNVASPLILIAPQAGTVPL